jgi:hypothetical protein
MPCVCVMLARWHCQTICLSCLARGSPLGTAAESDSLHRAGADRGAAREATCLPCDPPARRPQRADEGGHPLLRPRMGHRGPPPWLGRGRGRGRRRGGWKPANMGERPDPTKADIVSVQQDVGRRGRASGGWRGRRGACAGWREGLRKGAAAGVPNVRGILRGPGGGPGLVEQQGSAAGCSVERVELEQPAVHQACTSPLLRSFTISILISLTISAPHPPFLLLLESPADHLAGDSRCLEVLGVLHSVWLLVLGQ